MGYLRAAFATTLNIVINAVTLGRYLLLEGRVRLGVFKNWALGFRYRPSSFIQPTTEEQIIDLVKGPESIRVVGAAHSFNQGVVVDGTLLSLDKYVGVVREDLNANPATVTVRAGTRVRDVVAALLERNLAFRALPSHDAQSIGGILSTDVHGTGSEWGFVSEMVSALRIIDGTGQAHDCRPPDDLFKAAIGAVGAVGIIVEVTVTTVPRFDVQQIFKVVELRKVKKNFTRLLARYQHLSLYIFPFTEKCQISLWDPIVEPVGAKSFLGPLREFLAISFDALAAAWLAGLVARMKLLPSLSTLLHSVKKGTDLTLESNKAFNRTIYHLHQELEFAVPFEETFKRCEQFIRLYEDTYRETGLPYGFLEVRFTPEGHDRTLIGAGRERRSTWIDLIINDEPGYEEYYSRAEQLIRQIGARPHLGKFCKTLDASHLEQVHAQHFARFQAQIARHDPDGKFANEFTRRLFH